MPFQRLEGLVAGRKTAKALFIIPSSADSGLLCLAVPERHHEN